MRRGILRRLARDTRGVTVIEFAIVAPVMMTVIMGLSDLMYQTYVQSILNGAVVKAGRDSALEANAGDQSAIDAKVQALVGMLGPNMQFKSTRLSYPSFSVAKPEPFTDKNANGIRDPGECFDDINGNGKWDADPGRASQGGANDVTRYTMQLTYNRLFPVAGMFGWSPTATVSATTFLKNQPYKTQTSPTVVSICT